MDSGEERMMVLMTGDAGVLHHPGDAHRHRTNEEAVHHGACHHPVEEAPNAEAHRWAEVLIVAGRPSAGDDRRWVSEAHQVTTGAEDTTGLLRDVTAHQDECRMMMAPGSVAAHLPGQVMPGAVMTGDREVVTETILKEGLPRMAMTVVHREGIWAGHHQEMRDFLRSVKRREDGKQFSEQLDTRHG